MMLWFECFKCMWNACAQCRAKRSVFYLSLLSSCQRRPFPLHPTTTTNTTPLQLDWYLKILQIPEVKRKCCFIYLAMQTLLVFTSHVFRYSSLKWSNGNLHFKGWIHLCVRGVREVPIYVKREMFGDVSMMRSQIKTSQQLLKRLS